MSAYLLLIVTGAWLMPQHTFAQIPAACADEESLENLRCCPATADGVCGEDAGRGECVELNIEGYNRNTTNVRDNWPHYFTHVCQCEGDYSGYDCSRCTFGHYGPNCSQSQDLPRRPLASYTDDDWEDFIEIIQLMRSYDSGYVVILEESLPGSSSWLMRNITLYNLYVWLHQYASKDTVVVGPGNSSNPADYAHAGPSFTTWHRYFNLWLEWEIQYMLKSADRLDYHTFRLPYWDWRIEIQISTGLRAEELFTEARFGATRSSGFPHVFGNIVGESGWDTVCKEQFNICDPNDNTGPLQRCPLIGADKYNPCHSSNPDWPTIQQVNYAIAIDHYDSPPYNISSKTAFRPFIDFDIRNDLDDCRDDRKCTCFLPRGSIKCNSTVLPSTYPLNSISAFHAEMHVIGHLIPGRGYFGSDIPSEMLGNMVDFVASPNDPYFIIHHTMVDCIFDEWLKHHPDEEYPDVPLTPSTRGHLPHSYMVPFFPLYTNADMFKPAAGNFGYFCNLSNITIDSEVDNSENDDSQDDDSGSSQKMYPRWFTLWSLISLISIVLY